MSAANGLANARAVDLRFKGISAPVALDGAGDLLPAIDAVFPGWPRKSLNRRSPNTPIISIVKEGGRYRRRSRWVEESDLDDDPADAMCDFVSDVLDAYIEERPGMLGIHASAVQMRDGLVVFPSTHRSGKSLLTTYLVHRGAVLFSDDVLLLPPRSREGMATGIVPRLRLPIPEDTGREFRAFLNDAGMCANHRYGWVCLGPGQIAPLGKRAPVCAVVLLDRDKAFGGSASLDSVPRSDALSHLASRGFALGVRAGEVLSRLAALTEAAECLNLRYDAAEKAAEVLVTAFGTPLGQRPE